jgi:glyoxylase-like metal-dependent hydrolase (beta-lactamase superfamily II)
MAVRRFVLGDYDVNSYLIIDSQNMNCIIVDPGGRPRNLIDYIDGHNLIPKLIVNTHGHLDHIEGNGIIKERYNLQIAVGEADSGMLTDPVLNLSRFAGKDIVSPPASINYKDGDTIDFGGGKIKVLSTPGHSPGSITLVAEDWIICGDVLFRGSIGRTDFPGSDFKTLMDSIFSKLLILPPETAVYSGHGPETTIGEEKLTNPFLKNGRG